MNVHSRGEGHVGSVLEEFVAHGLGNFLNEVKIPSRGENGSGRETRCVIGVLVSRTGRIDTDAGRAVGKDGLRDSVLLKGAGRSGGSRNTVGFSRRDAVDHDHAGASYQKRRLVLEAHRLDYVFYVVFGEFRLSGQRKRGQCSHDSYKCFFHEENS